MGHNISAPGSAPFFAGAPCETPAQAGRAGHERAADPALLALAMAAAVRSQLDV